MGKSKKRKWFILLGSMLLLIVILIATAYYTLYKYSITHKIYKERVAYINTKGALLTQNFKICDSTYIIDYYNHAIGDSISRTTKYIHNKNGLRKEVLSKYENNNYSDSGYLNFRFIVNCKGEAGAYVIHENDLDLNPTQFNKDLVNQLFKITAALKKWQPNFMRGKERDSYMYISYRIENGEITEILP